MPTITGQLSFSLIGLGGSAPGTVVANGVSDDLTQSPTRYIAVSQRRRTKDRPWPLYLHPSAKADYILLGVTAPAIRPVLPSTAPFDQVLAHDDEVGVLKGRILVLPHHREARRAANDVLKKVRRAIAEAGDAAPRGARCQLQDLGARVEALLEGAKAKGVITIGADFALYRTGEFRLTLDDELPAVADDAGGPDATRFLSLMASQMYYFAKDISHRHYHHESSSDNLLPIVPASLDDDFNWRRETLWSLARAVLEMRRRNQLAGHKSALGNLAYAEAFQGLLAQVQRRVNDQGFERVLSGPMYDFTHTKMSLDATIEDQDYRKASWASLQGVVIATVLAGAALWLAAVQVRDIICPSGQPCPKPVTVPAWLSQVLRIVIEHPVVPFSLMLLVGLAYMEFTRRSLRLIGPVRGYSRWITSWSVAAGATASRLLRRLDPRMGDAFGASLAFVIVLVLTFEIIYHLGGLFRLWSAGWLVPGL